MTVQEIVKQFDQLSPEDQRELIHILWQRIPDANEDDVDPEELFREGWADVMEGRTHPIDSLWDDIDAE